MIYGSILVFDLVPFWLLLIFTDNFISDHSARKWRFAFRRRSAGSARRRRTRRKSPASICADWRSRFIFSPSISPAYLIGSNLIGYLSDKFGATENPAMMRYALLVCPISCLLERDLFILRSKRARIGNRSFKNAFATFAVEINLPAKVAKGAEFQLSLNSLNSEFEAVTLLVSGLTVKRTSLEIMLVVAPS